MHSGLVVLVRHLTMRKTLKPYINFIKSSPAQQKLGLRVGVNFVKPEFQDSKIIRCEPSRPIGLYLQNCRSTTHNLTLVNRRILS